MIRSLLFAGRELAGYTDPRVVRGLCWSLAEAVCAVAPFLLLYLLLLDVLHDAVSLQRTLWIAILMLGALTARVMCAVRAMPVISSGAYAMMGRARLRIADHLRCLPLGWFGTQRSGMLSATLASDLQVVEELWSHFLGVFFGGLLVPALLSAFLVD